MCSSMAGETAGKQSHTPSAHLGRYDRVIDWSGLARTCFLAPMLPGLLPLLLERIWERGVFCLQAVIYHMML